MYENFYAAWAFCPSEHPAGRSSASAAGMTRYVVAGVVVLAFTVFVPTGAEARDKYRVVLVIIYAADARQNDEDVSAT